MADLVTRFPYHQMIAAILPSPRKLSGTERRRMKPPFHEMSEREKRQVADELMMQPRAFGVRLAARSLSCAAY